MISFQVLNRFTLQVQFTAEIDCKENESTSTKLGLAVKWAIKNKANLRSANLSYANLSSADLGYADLRSANLSYANLSYADLRYADLRYANNSELAIARTVIVAQGELDVWKKCKDGILVELRIPREARRSSAGGRKCRCEFADVIKVHNESGVTHSTSDATHRIEYRDGNRVTCHEWDDNRWEECSGGIHFYLTKPEAEAH